MLYILLLFITFVISIYGKTETDQSMTCDTNKTTNKTTKNNNNFIIIDLIENENSNEFINNITYDILFNVPHSASIYLESSDSDLAKAEYDRFITIYNIDIIINNMTFMRYNKLKYWANVCAITSDYDVLHIICEHLSTIPYYLELEYEIKRKIYDFDKIDLNFDDYKQMKIEGKFCQYLYDYLRMMKNICSYYVNKDNNKDNNNDNGLSNNFKKMICEEDLKELFRDFNNFISDTIHINCDEIKKDLFFLGINKYISKLNMIELKYD